MNIFTPKKIGCCFGVNRAIQLTEDTLLKRKAPVYIFGELVHNETITSALSAKGLKKVKGIKDVHGGVLIIRAHGISPSERKEAEKRRIEIVDATCPIVRQAQISAQRLEEEGYQVVIVGDKNHAEIKGILGHLKKDAMVVSNCREVNPAKLKKRVGIIFQTTHSTELCRDVVAKVMEAAREIKIINTICADIRKRQEDAVALAKKVDLMIVVGSHHSSNTIKLKKLCLKYNPNTIQIETAGELVGGRLKKPGSDGDNLSDGVKSVGIIGGASTPDILIEEVKGKLKKMK